MKYLTICQRTSVTNLPYLTLELDYQECPCGRNYGNVPVPKVVGSRLERKLPYILPKLKLLLLILTNSRSPYHGAPEALVLLPTSLSPVFMKSRFLNMQHPLYKGCGPYSSRGFTESYH